MIETQPPVDYVLSVVDAPGAPGEALGRLREMVEAEIGERGAFRIDKISGVFIAET